MPSTSPSGLRPAKGKGLAGSRRARTARRRDLNGGAAPAGSDATSSGDERPRGTAKDRALRLLGVRWRSREELRRRLTRLGYPADEVEAALTDLEAVGLVDDSRFAREVVKDQSARRMAGDRAIRSALLQSGVDRDEIDRAVEAAGDEAERAVALAERLASRLHDRDTLTAQRRVMGQLLRRGYDHATARAATVRVLQTPDRGDADASGAVGDDP
jgi:regulatory protein